MPTHVYERIAPSAGSAGRAPTAQPRGQTVSVTQDIAGSHLHSSDKEPQRVCSPLALHVPLFSLLTFPLVRFDNQLNEGEVFTEAVCLLPVADFRESCVVTGGLRTKLLC